MRAVGNLVLLVLVGIVGLLGVITAAEEGRKRYLLPFTAIIIVATWGIASGAWHE